MTKAELTTAILERLHDPYDTVPDADTATLDFLTLDQAKEYLADLRRDEDAAELDQDERLPQEVTPELYMEVWNCDIRRCRYSVWVERLAGWLTTNECVCIHNQYHHDYTNDDPDVEPMDFLYEMNPDELSFVKDPGNTVEMLTLGMRSRDTFNPDHEYYWYDAKNDRLVSSDTPFADGICDATALARYAVMCSGECLKEILSQMDSKDMFLVFGTADAEEVKAWLS